MMVDQLKEILSALNDRVSVLEHSVNDDLIGGMKKAADKYKDDENYKAFGGKYGKSIDEVAPFLKCMNGDDFDSCRSMYDALKTVDGYGKDGFDEDGLMSAKIAELKDKWEKLRGMKALDNGTATTTQEDAISEEAEGEKPGDSTGDKEPDNDADDKSSEEKPENTKKDEVEVDEVEIPSDEQLAKELKKALES